MSKVAIIIDDDDLGAMTVVIEPLDDNDTSSPALRVAQMIHAAVPAILKPLVDEGAIAAPIAIDNNITQH